MGAAVIFSVTLRTAAAGAHRRLARTLKTAWRRDRLRAINVREIASPDSPATRASTGANQRRLP
jgi:hypothetical protein